MSDDRKRFARWIDHDCEDSKEWVLSLIGGSWHSDDEALAITNEKLGTVVVGVSGVEEGDLKKLQETYKLTTPLTVAADKDGPKAYMLNKEAAVTVLVYKKGGEITKKFAFKDTAAAANGAKDVAAAAESVVK